MRLLIADSSSLILSQKSGLLDCTKKIFTWLIPAAVYYEAIEKGKAKNSQDAYVLEQYLREKHIQLAAVQNTTAVHRIMLEFGIAQGETEAIVLFQEQKAEHVIVDDHKAMIACKVLKIPFITALTLVIRCVREKWATKQQAEYMLKQLAFYGRYKPELIFKALDEVNNHA